MQMLLQGFASWNCVAAGILVHGEPTDGAWPIPWGWADYPEEWAIIKNWWKGNGAILNLLYLRGMGRL
jgi:hypothetical protein